MSAAKKIITELEYLAFDEAHEGKHEFVNGEILAMAGATLAHMRATQNTWRALDRAFEGRPCEAFIAEFRVSIDETGMYAYPDVVVVCGEQQVSETVPESLLNPTILVEVLSPSTARYDRGEKAAHYRRGASVTDIGV